MKIYLKLNFLLSSAHLKSNFSNFNNRQALNSMDNVKHVNNPQALNSIDNVF